MVAYIAVVLALMLLPATVTARPRFLFTAFPLFISAAAWWPRQDRAGLGPAARRLRRRTDRPDRAVRRFGAIP